MGFPSQLFLCSFSLSPDFSALPVKAQSSREKKSRQKVIAAWREDSRGAALLFTSAFDPVNSGRRR